MLTIGFIKTFAGAHKLPFYEGKCRQLHGHTWKVEVELSGEPRTDGPYKGMIEDFKVLEEEVGGLIDELFDHQFINDLISNPTCEMITQHLVDDLKAYVGEGYLTLTRLRVWETDKHYCEWRAE